MPGGGRTAAGANRLHGEELQPTIFAEQVRLADRKSDRPLGSLKITCVPFCAATVPSYSPAESTTSAPAFRHLWPRASALRAAPGAFRSFREPSVALGIHYCHPERSAFGGERGICFCLCRCPSLCPELRGACPEGRF